MRYVRFDAGDGPREGVLREGHVQEGEGDPQGPGTPIGELTLLAPIASPSKIVCIGLNYRSHAEEQGAEPPETPTFFAKFPNALVGDGATVKLPTDKVDYEAEVAFVIGSECRDVAEQDALGHIAGYTLLNDLSARDRQFATPQWIPGKVFDGAAPCGPALVTPDETGPPNEIEIELRCNGELRQSATTADLVHPIPALVAHLSSLMTLVPGDLVATGTPAGVGSLRKPRSYLEPGDEVVISSPQLGTLTTHMA